MRLIEKKLCPKGKAAAKRKFSVYPSAYANTYASAVCSGKVKPGGKKKEKVNEGAKEDYKKADSDKRAQATFDRVMPHEKGSELDKAINKHSFAKGYAKSARERAKKKKVNEEKKPSMLGKMLQKATPAKKGKGDPLGTLRKMKDSLRRKEQRAKNGAKSSVEAYDAFRDTMDREGF